jgi:FkbM family methyltransferase
MTVSISALPAPIAQRPTAHGPSPTTLAWIDSFASEAVFWDIGANIGLYAIYAAKRHPELGVFAFEPSVLNTEWLVRNIALNEVEDRICIVPVPLSDKRGENTFRLSRFEHGGALSSFGVDYGHDGKRLATKLAYRTLGVSMDDAIAQLGSRHPTTSRSTSTVSST